MPPAGPAPPLLFSSRSCSEMTATFSSSVDGGGAPAASASRVTFFRMRKSVEFQRFLMAFWGRGMGGGGQGTGAGTGG